MTLLHFIGLDTDEQAKCIWQGTYLAARTADDHCILLYRIDDFYAEIFYDTRENKITQIKGFRANSHLIRYISSS